jgi:hypothetical protein
LVLIITTTKEYNIKLHTNNNQTVLQNTNSFNYKDLKHYILNTENDIIKNNQIKQYKKDIVILFFITLFLFIILLKDIDNVNKK